MFSSTRLSGVLAIKNNYLSRQNDMPLLVSVLFFQEMCSLIHSTFYLYNKFIRKKLTPLFEYKTPFARIWHYIHHFVFWVILYYLHESDERIPYVHIQIKIVARVNTLVLHMQLICLSVSPWNVQCWIWSLWHLYLIYSGTQKNPIPLRCML